MNETQPAATVSRARRFFPPLWVRLLAVGFLITAGIVRAFTITGDHALVNILTFFCVFLACSTVAAWFLFASAFRRRVRFAVAAATILLFVLFFGLFRIEELSGELVPTFRPRWIPRSDARVGSATPAAADKLADLTAVSATDFPQFYGKNRDGRVDGMRLATDWEQSPPQLLWRRPIGAGWSAFAVVGDFAVTLEQRDQEEVVTCYEIPTGALVWSHATTTRHETLMGGIGPRSTPTIDGGQVFAQGATGELVALSGARGELLWRVNLLERYGVPTGEDEKGVAWGRSGSPLVLDDLVIVPAGGPVGGPYVSLAAFHRATGELAWEAGDQQVSYSSPIAVELAGNRQVVCIHEKSVAGHDPATGKQLWSFDWPSNSNADANASQPIPVSENRLLLSKGYGRGAALIEITGNLEAGFDAREVWQDRTVLKTKFTSCVVHDGYAYGLSDGILECVEVASGQRLWKSGRFGQGQILGVGAHLLVQAESGEVVLLEATPDGRRELTRFPALDGKTWNNLCLSGKRLLVRNAEEAACFILP